MCVRSWDLWSLLDFCAAAPMEVRFIFAFRAIVDQKTSLNALQHRERTVALKSPFLIAITLGVHLCFGLGYVHVGSRGYQAHHAQHATRCFEYPGMHHLERFG